jgi:hypothetical protein
VDEGCPEEQICEIEVMVNPSEVLPKIKGIAGKADIVATLLKPVPNKSCVVELSVMPEDNTGGHSHVGGRPTGTLSSSRIEFSAGETGAKQVKYNSGEVAGTEKIRAKLSGSDKYEEFPINIRMPGLSSLGSSSYYRLTGSSGTTSAGACPGHPIEHPDNHYGTHDTVENTISLAKDFYKNLKATLGVNDMSLEWGGLFDICGNWWSPHGWHRKGTSVDIDRSAQGEHGRINVDRNTIEDLCWHNGKGTLVPEGTIHCEFTK